MGRAFELPDDVLIREVDGETVLVNLVDERWYELDAVGSDVVKRLISSPFEDALVSLQSDYDVEIEQLTTDVHQLVGVLLAAGLLAHTSSCGSSD